MLQLIVDGGSRILCLWDFDRADTIFGAAVRTSDPLAKAVDSSRRILRCLLENASHKRDRVRAVSPGPYQRVLVARYSCDIFATEGFCGSQTVDRKSRTTVDKATRA